MPGENGNKQSLGTFRIQDNDAWKGFKMYLQDKGITIEDYFNKIVNEKATEYDGLKHGLDKFVPVGYVPKPQFDDTFEMKLNWLKTQDDDKIKSIQSDCYKINIMCDALLNTPVSERKSVMPYMEAWQRFGKNSRR